MAQVAKLEKKVRFSTPDNWTLIQHIGQMQSTNPLRSIQELVDNAIDAFARDPTYIPKGGKQVRIDIRKGGPHENIKITDNGSGWEPDPETGEPNFEFTVQHIGDSIKKLIAEYQKAREEGVAIGQYALGLLSFWALGNRITIFSRSRLADGTVGHCSKMIWLRNIEEATVVHDVKPPEELDDCSGCVAIVDQLEKARMSLVTGNQLKTFLSRACRSRLMKTGVIVEICYKGKTLLVKPMKYEGILFATRKTQTRGGFGSIEMEIYLFPPVQTPEEYKTPIFCKGAKVYDDITQIEELDRYPWNAKKVYGQIDYAYGTISPSRSAFVNDKFLEAFIHAMKEVTEELSKKIEEIESKRRKKQRRRFYDTFHQTWQDILKALPEEWQRKLREGGKTEREETEKVEVTPGPMFRLEISPENTQVKRGAVQSFTARPYDINGNLVTDPDMIYNWKIEPALGILKKDMYRTCILQAGKTDGIITITVRAFQYIESSGKEETLAKTASTNIWIVEEVQKKPPRPPKGEQPPLLEEIALAGEVHSKYSPETNVVQVNNQHEHYQQAEKKDLETLYKYINYCYCKEIAVDRWKNLVTDAHELSERITDLLAVSELSFDWKGLTKRPRGRPPKTRP